MYYRRYRPRAFVQNQKGTCRQCDAGIYFIFAPEYNGELRTKGIWAHEGFTMENFEQQEHYPNPKEFCCETVTTDAYDTCGSPVKFEDIKAGNYACGRHMRKWNEERDYRERAKLEQERRDQREKLEAYEVIQYHEAGEWIKQHFPRLIESSYTAKHNWGSFKRTTPVDVFMLKEFLEGVVNRLAASPGYVVDLEGGISPVAAVDGETVVE